MTVTYTKHFRFGIPDFTSSPWHDQFHDMVQHIDDVLYDALFLAGATIWENDEDYDVGHVVISPDDGSVWITAVAHTSAGSGSFEDDRTANPSYWTESGVSGTTPGGSNGAVQYKNGGAFAGSGIHWDESGQFVRIDGNTRLNFSFEESYVTLTDAPTVNLDAGLGNLFRLDASGNRTIAVPTSAPGPNLTQKIIIRHKAVGANRTLTLASGAGGFRFGATLSSLSATLSGKIDYIGCIWNLEDSRWDVVAYSKGY